MRQLNDEEIRGAKSSVVVSDYRGLKELAEAIDGAPLKAQHQLGLKDFIKLIEKRLTICPEYKNISGDEDKMDLPAERLFHISEEEYQSLKQLVE